MGYETFQQFLGKIVKVFYNNTHGTFVYTGLLKTADNSNIVLIDNKKGNMILSQSNIVEMVEVRS